MDNMQSSAVERIWQASYPAGVPYEIDDRGYRSCVDLIDQSVENFRERDAYVFMDKAYKFGEVDRMAQAFASWLQSKGLAKGTRVAIMVPNCPQYPIALFGILRAGCVVVNVNPMYTPRELEHQLKDSGAEAIVILENFCHTLEAVITHTMVREVVVTNLGELLGFPKGPIVNFVVRHVKKMVPAWKLPGHLRFSAALQAGERHPFRPVELCRDDAAFLQYTGGTTGVAKGATLLHRNIVANVLQADAWLQPGLRRDGQVEQVRIVTALPLYHVFALTGCCLLGLRIGGLNLLIPNARDIPALIQALIKHPCHMLPAVNTLFNAMMNHPDFPNIDFKTMRLCVGGGMAVQKAVADRWFAATGRAIIEGYGLSETSPIAACNRADSTEYTGTIGLPVSSTDIVIRDDDGKDVPQGQPGEICIRGPQVMAGYWNRPDETAKVMYADGFFRSGDIGFINAQGYVKIVDRKKDMIKVSGFNVYPNEIEEVVAMHPGVLEVAAIGVPDEHSGEVIKIFVVKKDPHLTEHQLMEYCKQELTGYKRPRHIEFRAELPKTNVGKILRRELRDGEGANAAKKAA